MKRTTWFLLIGFLFCAFAFVTAQEIDWASQNTYEWDEVTTYVDGGIIPAEYLPVTYRPFMAEWDHVAARRVDGTEAAVGETTDLFFTYTIPYGLHDVGVQAVIFYGSYASTSTITWLSEQADSRVAGNARAPAAPATIAKQ